MVLWIEKDLRRETKTLVTSKSHSLEGRNRETDL